MIVRGNVRCSRCAGLALWRCCESPPAVARWRIDRPDGRSRMKVQRDESPIARGPGALNRRRRRHHCGPGISQGSKVCRRVLLAHRQLRRWRHNLRTSNIDVGQSARSTVLNLRRWLHNRCLRSLNRSPRNRGINFRRGRDYRRRQNRGLLQLTPHIRRRRNHRHRQRGQLQIRRRTGHCRGRNPGR